ncbi:MAG: M56 family metallopeptidase [Oscillospiraceae bacterium]|nr:M56 family metallopeptidase [Oscillospiraceae bacterium]
MVNILQMSLSASLLILVVIIIRSLAINTLPKRTFLGLWAVAALRLMLPFSIPLQFNVYPIIKSNITISDTAASIQVPLFNISLILTIIWIFGAIICLSYFVIAYIKCYNEFKAATIVQNDFITAWLDEYKILRSIRIKQFNKISAPLTYGIFRPIILIPENVDWSDEKKMLYILAHEYEHIRNFDSIKKLFLTAILCVHWFNPLVWVMYIFSNRDIELSCDESVLRSLGKTVKSSYARVLVSMEENKNKFTPFYSSFNKFAEEERILAIMKYKKPSKIIIILSAILVALTSTAFAFSINTASNSTAFSNKTVSNSTANSLFKPLKNIEDYQTWPIGYNVHFLGENGNVEQSKTYTDVVHGIEDTKNTVRMFYTVYITSYLNDSNGGNTKIKPVEVPYIKAVEVPSGNAVEVTPIKTQVAK